MKCEAPFFVDQAKNIEKQATYTEDQTPSLVDQAFYPVDQALQWDNKGFSMKERLQSQKATHINAEKGSETPHGRQLDKRQKKDRVLNVLRCFSDLARKS